MGLGLSALLFLGTASAFIGLAPAKAAHAAEAPVTLTTENADLFLPTTYEQYLSLENPTDVAICDKYIAVAQSNQIYVCNRTGDKIAYRCYDHVDGSKNSLNVSKIQFSENDELYFSDQDTHFYKLDLGDLTSDEVANVNASTFYIAGDILFSAVVTGDTTYYQYSLNNFSEKQQIDYNKGLTNTPQLTFYNNRLYSVVDRLITVYEYSEAKKYYTCSTPPLFLGGGVMGVKSAYALNGFLYYTIDNANPTEELPNGIYCFNFATQTSSEGPLKEGSGYGSLTAYNGYLYAIEGNAVIEHDVTDTSAAHTGYEISSSSASENRLGSAADTVRAGDLLVTADAENKRVSVYSFSKKEYSVIPCDFVPSIVATDGETIAVACGAKIYTCIYGDKSFTHKAELQSNVKGLACVYGSVYYVSNNAVYGCLGVSETVSHDYGIPHCMTSDLYGTIYVSTDRGLVYSFTEESFLIKNQGTRLDGLSALPENHSSLRADFEGNLYYLSENKIYKNNEEFAIVDGYEFVYHKDAKEETDAPVSFALGFEDSEVYVFFKNHAVKSKAETLDIPTLDKIVAGTIADEVFSVHAVENLLVDVPAKTVGIKIKLDELAGAEYFPYDSYSRLTEEYRGVVLGTTDRYRLVLLPDDWSYTAMLFKTNSVSLTEEDYCPEYYEDANELRYEINGSYYLSSGVHSYYAPCLEPALQSVSLPRGAYVTVIGFITAPERDYALVSYEDGETAREVKTGYVPSSFLSVVSPLPSDSAEYLPVYLKASEDGIVFHAEDNEADTITITERYPAKAIKNADGTYTVIIEQNGKTYVADSVKESQLDWQKSDALRIALIIILSVLALVIIGTYIFLLPRKTKDGKKKKKAEKTPAKKE